MPVQLPFTRHSAMLLTADVPSTRDFYVRMLGLTVNADIGWFVGLERRLHTEIDFELSICAADHASVPPTIRQPSRGMVLAFEVADVDAIHDQWRAAGVSILAAPVNEPWGQRHFFAAAPDGVALDVFMASPPDMDWMRAHGFA